MCTTFTYEGQLQVLDYPEIKPENHKNVTQKSAQNYFSIYLLLILILKEFGILTPLICVELSINETPPPPFIQLELGRQTNLHIGGMHSRKCKL